MTYQGIALQAFGSTGEVIVKVILAFVQFSYTVRSISFGIQIIGEDFFEEGNAIVNYCLGLLIVCVYGPMAWVRRI